MYKHFICKKNSTKENDKSVHLSNMVLAHIETHRLDGIVYFADDSNQYYLDIFEQMGQIN